MVDSLTCMECGNEISPNDTFCPKCKCNTKPATPSIPVEPLKINKNPNKVVGFFKHPIWGIFQLIMGVSLFMFGSEWYHYLIGTIGLMSGGHSLYKYQKAKKQVAL